MMIERKLWTKEHNVLVRFHTPEPHPLGDWACRVEIELDGEIKFDWLVPGIDGLQAMQLAMERARATLKTLDMPLRYDGGHWELGFPRFAPTFLGRKVMRRVHEAIDREIASNA